MKKIISLSILMGIVVGASVISLLDGMTIKKERETKKRLDKYYKVLMYWVSMKIAKRSIEEFFVENHYKTIAVYGLGELGRRLVEELSETGVKVQYIIDQNRYATSYGIDLVTMNDKLNPVDVIVVTPVHHYEKIAKELQDKANCSIISLEDVIYSLL